MAYEPTDVAQQALDAAGVEYTLGNIEDGTRQSQVVLRAYERCRKQLLRAANWDFARRQAPLQLLADSTGNNPTVGRTVPLPWTYEYGYPTDCVRARFVPWNQSVQNPGVPTGNITPPDPTAPLMTNLSQPPVNGQRIVPARFVVTNDPNNLGINPGYDTPGMSPAGRTVICTNVQYAQLIYTCDQVYPSIWDELFRAALVSYLASEVGLPLSKDKKFGLSLRNENIKIAKAKITEARIADGNEGWYSSDIRVDWIDARAASGGNAWNNGQGGGPGYLSSPYGSCGFADSSAY